MVLKEPHRRWVFLATISILLLAAISLATTMPNTACTHESWGAQVAEAADWFLKHKKAPKRRDCSGLVIAILDRAGMAISGGVRDMWQQAKADGRVADEPHPGYLVFFNRTYDKNQNGKEDDLLTHIAIVIDVGDDGKIGMVHLGNRGIRPLRMNRARPHQHRDGSKVVNDYLSNYRLKTQRKSRLTAELYHSYASPPGPECSLSTQQ